MEEKKQWKSKPHYNGNKHKNNVGNTNWRKPEKKFDVEKWIKQHQNRDVAPRGKKNTIEKDNRKK